MIFRFKDIKDTWQINAICHLGLDPGLGKNGIRTLLGQEHYWYNLNAGCILDYSIVSMLNSLILLSELYLFIGCPFSLELYLKTSEVKRQVIYGKLLNDYLRGMMKQKWYNVNSWWIWLKAIWELFSTLLQHFYKCELLKNKNSTHTTPSK